MRFSKNPAVTKAFTDALAASRFTTMYEWGVAVGLREDITKFYRYAKGQAHPRLPLAIRIARLAETAVEALWGSLTEPEPEPELMYEI